MQNGLISIYDTTLRDGSQGEGVSFTVAAKLRIAEKLDQFKVDYIEGGWPGSNPRDMSFFEEAKKLNLNHSKIVAFGSTRRANMPVETDPQIKLLLEAETSVITIFGKSWLLHVTEILKTTPDENLKMIEDSVRYLTENNIDVIYDAEHFFDGYKDNKDYAIDTLLSAKKAGATNITLCDTNGGCLVDEVFEIVSDVKRIIKDISIGVHCHNDSGLGVAVSLAGINAGANMVQGTINGIGERNGNANLTSIIPNIALKMNLKMNCSNKLTNLKDLSMFVDEMANLSPDSKAPFVGLSSFAHKGGVHADAAAKVKISYEHIKPELVGNKTRVLISDMSGKSSIIMKAKEIGLNLDVKSDKVKELLKELKDLEFKGYEYEAADASLKLLINRFINGSGRQLGVLSYQVIVQDNSKDLNVASEAIVKLNINGKTYENSSISRGPVDALNEALRNSIEPVFPEVMDVKLLDFKVRILENKEGTDAIIRVHIESTDGDMIWGTVGASDNIIEAAWEALLDSVEYKIQLSRGV